MPCSRVLCPHPSPAASAKSSLLHSAARVPDVPASPAVEEGAGQRFGPGPDGSAAPSPALSISRFVRCLVRRESKRRCLCGSPSLPRWLLTARARRSNRRARRAQRRLSKSRAAAAAASASGRTGARFRADRTDPSTSARAQSGRVDLVSAMRCLLPFACAGVAAGLLLGGADNLTAAQLFPRGQSPTDEASAIEESFRIAYGHFEKRRGPRRELSVSRQWLAQLRPEGFVMIGASALGGAWRGRSALSEHCWCRESLARAL